MGEHDSWLSYLPGYANLQAYAAHYLERTWVVPGLDQTHFSIAHVAIALLVTLLLSLAALRYWFLMRPERESRLVPEPRFGVRNLFEIAIEATLGLAEGVMGRERAEHFLPLFGTLVLFILFNNLIGLVPGFLPPTDTLKTNLALSGLVLVVTHGYGIKQQGLGYFKHFVAPILGLPWYGLILLVPLFVVIEGISHFAVRPLSLAIRLLGNMFADHKLLGTISLLVPLLVPLPFYVLGLLVCVVQTLVFTLLSMIYIGEATAHEAH